MYSLCMFKITAIFAHTQIIGGGGIMTASSKNWPKSEILTVINSVHAKGKSPT